MYPTLLFAQRPKTSHQYDLSRFGAIFSASIRGPQCNGRRDHAKPHAILHAKWIRSELISLAASVRCYELAILGSRTLNEHKMNDQLLKRCMLVAVSTWSDALDSCGISGVMVGLQQRAGSQRFAGFAVTARETAGEFGSFERREFGIGPIIDAVNSGDVLIIDLGGAPVSTMGGLAALATRKRDAAAVIIDGGCRDIDEIQATGLWVASSACYACDRENSTAPRRNK